MNLRSLSLILGLLLAAFPTFVWAREKISEVDLKTADGKEAETFIQDLGDRGIAMLTGKSLSKTERRNRFESLFVTAFDYERIGKFVLGQFRRSVSASEMKEYLDLFRGMVVRVYAARFGEYNDEKFQTLGSRIIDRKVDTVIVSSKIIRRNDSKVMIEWHLYKHRNGDFKIFDVVVEGVSMALTQRSEFSSILQNGGIQGLMTELRRQKKSDR